MIQYLQRKAQQLIGIDPAALDRRLTEIDERTAVLAKMSETTMTLILSALADMSTLCKTMSGLGKSTEKVNDEKLN